MLFRSRTAAALGVLGVFAGLLGMNILPIENGLWHGSSAAWFFSGWSFIWTAVAVALTLGLTADVGWCAYMRQPEWLAGWLGQKADNVASGAKNK